MNAGARIFFCRAFIRDVRPFMVNTRSRKLPDGLPRQLRACCSAFRSPNVGTAQCSVLRSTFGFCRPHCFSTHSCRGRSRSWPKSSRMPPPPSASGASVSLYGRSGATKASTSDRLQAMSLRPRVCHANKLVLTNLGCPQTSWRALGRRMNGLMSTRWSEAVLLNPLKSPRLWCCRGL